MYLLAGSLMVNRKTVNLGDKGSTPFPSAKKYEFACRMCGEQNHFYILGEPKELRKVIWACKFCHHKNRIYLK